MSCLLPDVVYTDLFSAMSGGDLDTVKRYEAQCKLLRPFYLCSCCQRSKCNSARMRLALAYTVKTDLVIWGGIFVAYLGCMANGTYALIEGVYTLFEGVCTFLGGGMYPEYVSCKGCNAMYTLFIPGYLLGGAYPECDSCISHSQV
jgi:hypothetical protein